MANEELNMSFAESPQPMDSQLMPNGQAEIDHAVSRADAAATKANEAAQQVKQDAESGKFTPVKGVDYWTPADVEAMDNSKQEAYSAADDARQAVAEIERKVANGEFNGKDGAPGKDGKTPVKGVDYDTPEEVAARQEAIDKANNADLKVKEFEPKLNHIEGIAANQPINHAQGTLVHVEDAYATQPLKLVTQGKTAVNLWPATGHNGVTVRGITWTINPDGSVKAVGTTEGTYQNHATLPVTLVPGKTYTLSCEDTVKSTYVTVSMTLDDGERINKNASAGYPSTFTVPSNLESATKTIFLETSGLTIDNTFHVMLVEGSEPKPWTPSGITCVNNVDLVMSGKGKNLLPPPKSNGVQETEKFRLEWNTDGSYLIDTKTSEHIETQPIELCDSVRLPEYSEFYLHFRNDKWATPVEIYFYDEDMQQITWWALTEENRIKQVPKFSNSKPKYVLFKSSQAARIKLHPSIEYSANPTPYEPYQGSTTVIDLQGQKACDVPDGTHDQLEITPRADGLADVVLVKNTKTENAADHTYERVQDYSGRKFVSFGVEPSRSVTEKVYCDKIPSNTGGVPDIYRTWNSIIIMLDGFSSPEEATRIIHELAPKVVYAIPPKRIPLGTVELPKLPPLTANVWSDTNMPEVVTEMDYIQDINEVLSDIRQAITALPANL